MREILLYRYGENIMKSDKKNFKNSGAMIGVGTAIGAAVFAATGEATWIAVGVAIGAALSWRKP